MTDFDSTTSDGTSGEKSHTDIRKSGWIESRLPINLRPYAYLARLDRPIGTWLLLLPALWSIVAAGHGISHMKSHDWYVFLLFSIGAFVMRGAGCVVNDLWDRNIDAKVERTKSRPLASGEITPTKGFLFLILLTWIGLMILVQLNTTTILLGVLSVFMVILYPLAKRVTWYPQFVLGLTFNIGALMGWSAVIGELQLPALLFYAAGIFWTLGYDTIYAHQDCTDDAVVGVKSTALKFGDQSEKWIAGFYAAAVLMFALTGWTLHAGWIFYTGWAAASFHLIIQLALWDRESPASCLETFRSNRNFGFLVLFALAFINF